MKKGKTTELTIRLNEADRRAIVKAAEEEHVPASTWARQVILGRVAEKRAARERRARTAELVRRMRDLPAFNRGDD
jgi:hypothetical protein